MQIDPNSNPWFIPSAAPQGTSELDHLNKGLYAYVNAAHDPELKKQADTIFGRTVPFDNSETQATLIGRSWCSRSGYLADPVRYCRDNKLPLPPNWSGENAQLYTLIGQNYIGKAQEHFNNQKAAREKALADAQKDYTETMGELPSLLAKSIRSAGGEKGTPLTPQYLEKLTKYGAREGAIQSQQRAATAWMYMSAYMDDIDSMQSTGRDKLLDIANTLSDDKGQLDPHATAAFLMMMEDKATELQSTDSQFWADFADKFQNFLSRTEDQIGKAYTNKGKGWDSSIINPSFIVSTNPELDPNWLASQDNEPDPTYNDPRVEQLYGYMQRAINTAIAPSEKAEWYAKLLSEMGGLVGESAIPMALGIAASAATAGAGGGAFLSATAGYGAGFAATAPSTINASIAEAYAQGKVNPELYGTLEGIGQAAAENIGGPATSLKLFTKTAGKITNWAASRTAGSRFLANQYARTTLNYLTAGAFESLTELGEEELGGYIGSRLNALAREMGATVSPQAYKLGETLSNMKAHEVAAIFGYSYALGLWGIPANYRSARTFAQNTDNLLKAGHTPATARDIQHRAFQTEDKIADIAANPNLSPEQKAEAIHKEEQDFCVYQQNKFNNEILSDPNLRSRLQKEGRDIRDEAEVALDVEHEADLQILKDNGILQAVIIPGQKYQVAFLEEGETKEDGTRAPGKLITQEWSRTQLTNWLMLQKNTRIEQDLRSFNSLLLAHAHAQSATPEETKTHFQNLGANRPLAALGELHKRGITPDFFRKAAEHALALQTQHENAGMSPQEAAQQPHPDFAGLSLGEVQNLSTDAATRKEQELATTGQLQSINATTNIEYGALNILRRDGTGLIKYVAGKANLLDLLEERFEIDIKQRTRGNKQLADQLAQTLLHIQSHLPGNIRLLDPAKKGRYTQSDFVEAYSKIAIGNFLLNQQNLPINQAGHRLVQNIARAVDTTRMFQTIGNAWLAYANSPEGKAHLEESGHSIADIMREAGFTFSNQIAQARATADQRTEVLQASNWQPAIEDELDALLEDIEAEEQLAELNQQEAAQPTTIPAEESITGQEIVIEPSASEDTTTPATTSASEDTTAPTSEATTTPATDLSGEKATTILSHMRDLIAKGKARAEHFAIVFREIPGLTEAQAIEQGIRPLTQRGEPTAAYTQGKLLAERCTDAQYLLLKSGKLPQKAKRDILGAPTQTRKNPAWPKIAKKGIAPAEQRLTIIKALQNAVDYAAENPNYNLNFTRHIISKGREYYVATDGRRLAVIERIAPKGSKDIEESLDKNGNVVKDAKFPESWRQVMIALTDKAQTLDLAPFRFLETYPKTAINHVVWQDSQGKLSKYNPNYIGKGIKFFSTLSKAIGSPSTIQVDNQSMGPILMQSDHDGWTAKYLLMPMRVVDGDIYKEGDILLSPQPSEHANFSIIGPRAKTWDKYVQDGRVFKGRDDGRLRAEIDDSKAKLITNFRNIQDLEDILVHPELFDAYPELRDITVIVKDLTNFEYPASAYRNGSIITLSSDYVRMSDADEILGTLLHEIGHYIQEKEEFLSGGNPSSARFLLKKLIQQAESKDSEYWLDVLSEKESILKEAKRLKKEIEQYEQSTPDDNSLPSKIKNQTDQLEKTVKSYNERINSKEPENGSFAATYLPSCDSYFSINLMKDELDYIIEYANVHQNDFVAFREEMQRRIKNRSTLLERYKNLESLSDEELYLRIPGEIESRNVANRRAWNEEERTLRPFNETLEYASESLSNFSIKPAADTLDRFTADPLGERIIHHIRTESRRYARLLGDKAPYEQAVNAAQSAASIISAVDKFLHTPGKPVPARYRRQLQKLRSIAEKYAQIIASGTPRSFKKISPQEQKELEAAIENTEAWEDAHAMTSTSRAGYEQFVEQAEINVLREMYIKHARAMLAEISKSEYKTPVEVNNEIKKLEKQLKSIQNKESRTKYSPTYLKKEAEQGYSDKKAVSKYLGDIGKDIAKQIKELQQKDIEAKRKFDEEKQASIKALGYIIETGKIPANTALTQEERQQLEERVQLDIEVNNLVDVEAKNLQEKAEESYAQRQKEHDRRILRAAARGRIYVVLSSMLEVTADALDSYLKHQLLQKLDRLTATVKIKRSPSKRLQGKMTAPAYRELERAINLMALSDRAYQDEIENVITAHETLARAINQGNTNLTSGNALLIQLADQLTTSGQQVTPQTLTAALANHEAALKIYGNVSSKTYEQTRLMANALFYLIRNGRNQWKAKHEAREAFIQQYLQHFLSHTPATSGTEQTARLAKEKEQKGTGFTRFANSMMNSTQLFHALSGIEALAPLMEHTKQALATAGVARDLHMKQMVEQVQASYGRILGIKPATTAGYTQRQLKEISAKLDKFYEQNNQVEQTNITRHYIDADGNHQTEQLKLTKWQALDLILTYRQQHYRPNAQEHGYTDELLAQLENWCGEDLLTLGNAMQQSIPNDGTIPVYEEREGIPLRDNPLYWPAHLNIAEQETPDHPAISNPYHAAGSYRFLKGRTSNLREVAARNAYNVWKSAIAERANYVYLAPITDTLNSLLARKEFAARLKTLIGPSLYEQLKLTLKEIDGTTWAETSLQEDPHGAIARTLRNMAPALLAGNPTTLIKQSSAIANATLMPDFPPHEFAKQLIKLQQNQSGITIGQILRLDAFKARVRDNSALNDMLALGTDAKYSTYANLARSWMGLIDATDTFFNAIGATLYYNHKYEQYTKENQENGSPLTQAEIHAKCETDITVMLALTAQPLKRTDKSAFFWRNSKTLLGPLYLYMGSEMINKVGMARANWLKRKAQGMGAAQNTLNWMYQLGAGVGGVAFLTSIACAILTGNTPDDDDSLSAWLIATYLHSAFGQYTSQMPVIGQIIDLALSPYAQFIDGVADFPGVKTATAAKKLGTMITDDKTYIGAEWQTQINRLARDLNGITGYWGGVNSQTRWLTVTSSILQTFTAASNWITPIAKGATHDAFFADWLPDWYTQTDTRSPRRPKSLIEQWLTPDTEESPRRRRSTTRRSTARARRRTTPRKRKRQEE